MKRDGSITVVALIMMIVSNSQTMVASDHAQTMSVQQQKVCLDDVEKTMKKAGEILMTFFNSSTLAVTYKPGYGGPVTQADIESEKCLIQGLKQTVPGAAFLAEESGSQGTGDYCWVIDPLDGTNNFSHGIPYFCISVALTFKGKPVFGAIYDPTRKEFFHAFAGGGAYLNRKAIQVAPTADTSKQGIILAVGIPNTEHAHYATLMKIISFIEKQRWGIRRLGSTALDLAYLAAGRLDGIVMAGRSWWDMAAGAILVAEAGGKITDFDCKAVNAHMGSLLAGAPWIYDHLFQLIKSRCPDMPSGLI